MTFVHFDLEKCSLTIKIVLLWSKLYTFYVKVIKTFSKYTVYLYHGVVWYCISVFTVVINIFFFQHPYINPPSFISCNSEGVITVRNFLPNGTLRDCLCKVIYCFLIINTGIPFSLKQYVLKSGENN